MGAPSSAGAYAPGQEQAPAALRSAGLPERLTDAGLDVLDFGDVERFRWRPDARNPRARNAKAVARVARDVGRKVCRARTDGRVALVLGGDCTVELGTVSGVLRHYGGSGSVGLVYVDLDADLNTPDSTADGALDWMGVAHLLDLPNCVSQLAGVGPRRPLLRPEDILLFAPDRITPFEAGIIEAHSIVTEPLVRVAADPEGTSAEVVEGWGRRFDHLLVHVDVDVLDYTAFPLAENTRRTRGLDFVGLVHVLHGLLAAPNLAAITVTEVNPDHADTEGDNLRALARELAAALAGAPTSARNR